MRKGKRNMVESLWNNTLADSGPKAKDVKWFLGIGWVYSGGTYPSGFKSSTWHECSYFSGFILGFNGIVLSVVGDIPVDSEAPVVTSSISTCAGKVFRRYSYG